jgi:hypothetical protein
MSHHTIRSLTGNSAPKAVELCDINEADLTPTQDPNGFDHVGDEMTEAEIDRLYVEEMTRRVREGAAVVKSMPAGYVDAPCAACGAALFVPTDTPDPLCRACDRIGNDLAQADGDGRPKRRGGTAALPPEYAYFSEYVKRWPDDQLVSSIAFADRGELDFAGNKTAANAAWLRAATAEVLCRLAA